MKRYFEFVDAKSSKFWEVWIEDSTVHTRFGKIGANGQTTVKEFPNTDAAQATLVKAVGEKLKKGYVEVELEQNSTPTKQDDTLESRAIQLIGACEAAITTKEEIDEIIADHSACAEEQDFCELCHRLWIQDEEDGMDLELAPTIWHSLASRTDLTPQQADKVLLAGVSLGGDCAVTHGIIHRLAQSASSLTEEFESVVTDLYSFVSYLWDDYPQYQRELLEVMKSNPAFPKSFIAEFIESNELLDEHDGPDSDPGPDYEATLSCPQCDALVFQSAKFCPECGSELVPTPMFCVECGAKREGSGKFCADCGHQH